MNDFSLKSGASRPHWGPAPRFAGAEGANTMAGRVFQAMRADIIAGRLRPDEKLHLARLRGSYSAGISPVREALNQLAADGLVRAEGQKGFRVAPVSLGEYDDIRELRIRFDEMALRSAIAHGDAEWEARIAAEFHRTSRLGEAVVAERDKALREALVEEWEDTHRRFHVALCSACESPWLLHFCERLYDQMERYRRCFWTYSQRLGEAAEEHDAIKDAVLARDADKACALLSQHYRHQGVKTARALRAAGVT